MKFHEHQKSFCSLKENRGILLSIHRVVSNRKLPQGEKSAWLTLIISQLQRDNQITKWSYLYYFSTYTSQKSHTYRLSDLLINYLISVASITYQGITMFLNVGHSFC